MNRFTTQPTNLDRLTADVEGQWDDRETYRDLRMIALVVQQHRELTDLMVYHGQERLRIGLAIREERDAAS